MPLAVAPCRRLVFVSPLLPMPLPPMPTPAALSQQLCPTYTVKQGDGLTNVVQSAQAMGLNITMAQLMSTLTQYLGWTSSSTLQANQVRQGVLGGGAPVTSAAMVPPTQPADVACRYTTLPPTLPH